MQITEQLNLNETSQKIDKAKANTNVVLYYNQCSKKKQWSKKQ